ncbi:MAG TPA: SRPBCC family protein [Candidatus Thermoplasmatota archaeon]|nr:SRPBCC family protein [Candidatus Thermoplasmatota archaeon]
MERIEKSIEVAVPVRTAYNQWTQFESFPLFMEGVQQVDQLDDKRLRWVATIAGRRKEWEAEIIEQTPDQVISWRSVTGALNNGSVQFTPIDSDRCRITLILTYEPEGALERAGDALGLVSMRVSEDLERFKSFIEERQVESGGWRGEIHDGRVQSRRPARPGSVRSKVEGLTKEGGF